MTIRTNNYPKLHNAAWPGVVGKGPGAEPPIDLDTMLDLTAAAEVEGVRFDGFDLFLYDPHIDIDAGDDEIKRLADKARSRNLEIGTVVAPVWPPPAAARPWATTTTAGSFSPGPQGMPHRRAAAATGHPAQRRGADRLGLARGGLVRRPEAISKRIAETFREACKIAEDHGERLAAEGEICWGGMHSWKRMVQLLEMVDRPQTLGFQADMAHTLLYLLGYNAPEDAMLPPGFRLARSARLRRGLRQLTAALRPWTIDFHVAQNDATVHGTGSHDKTGRHCLPTIPTASSTSPATPAIGSATRRAS